MSRFKRRKTNRFKRKYNPKCYICEKPIKILVDLKKAKEDRLDSYEKLWKKAVETTVQFPHNGKTLYRHNRDSCEPNVDNIKEVLK